MEEHTGTHEEHHAHVQESHHTTRKPMTEKLRANPWIVSSLVLGIIVIIFLANNFYSGMAGNIVSENVAAQKVLDFANSQTGGGVELVEVLVHQQYVADASTV